MVTQQFDPIDERLEQRAKALLDQSADELDARTRSKLTQARYAAAAELHRSRINPWLRWTPALAAAVVAAIVITYPTRDASRPESAALLEDFDLVAGAESFELLQDMEFYAWLDESDAGDSG